MKGFRLLLFMLRPRRIMVCIGDALTVFDHSRWLTARTTRYLEKSYA